ncbi:PDZ domain-containing protein [Planctomycetota bacterium]
MNCKECREAVPLIPGGELDDDKMTEALNHIQECDECRIECEKYAFLKKLLAGMKNMDDIPFNWEQLSAATVEKAFLKGGKGPGMHRRAQFAPYIRAAVLIITAGLFFSAGLFWNSEDTSSREQYREGVEHLGKLPQDYKPSGEPLREMQPWEVPLFLKEDLRYPSPDSISKGFESINRNEESMVDGAWLGLQVRDLAQGNVMVEEIIQGSPSDKSGIASGDIICSCDGNRITCILNLQRILSSASPGTKITLVVIRKGKKHNVTVTAAPIPHHL